MGMTVGEKQMEGKFWIRDLKSVLQEEGIFKNNPYEDHDGEKVFLDSIWVPSQSKFKRWLHNENIHRSISYYGPIIVNFEGYYDFSGRDIKVVDNTFNSFIPEDFPMFGIISKRIASENGIEISENDCFYGSDEPTNDLEEFRRQIRGINASREKIDSCAKQLADKLYELAT